MAKTRATYIFYYVDKDGNSEGMEAYGIEDFYETLKWLHSDEIKATDISIYKRGKDFENDPDDVIEVYRQYWK